MYVDDAGRRRPCRRTRRSTGPAFSVLRLLAQLGDVVEDRLAVRRVEAAAALGASSRRSAARTRRRRTASGTSWSRCRGCGSRSARGTRPSRARPRAPRRRRRCRAAPAGRSRTANSGYVPQYGSLSTSKPITAGVGREPLGDVAPRADEVLAQIGARVEARRRTR